MSLLIGIPELLVSYALPHNKGVGELEDVKDKLFQLDGVWR
jgi:hypothetical protein